MAALEPHHGTDYPLVLGASLQGGAASHADQFLALRYDFKPASAAQAAQGVLDVLPNNQAQLQMGDSLLFQGRYEAAGAAGLDCVAIFDGQSFRLELLSATVQSLRHVPGASRGAGRSLPQPAARGVTPEPPAVDIWGATQQQPAPHPKRRSRPPQQQKQHKQRSPDAGQTQRPAPSHPRQEERRQQPAPAQGDDMEMELEQELLLALENEILDDTQLPEAPAAPAAPAPLAAPLAMASGGSDAKGQAVSPPARRQQQEVVPAEPPQPAVEAPQSQLTEHHRSQQAPPPPQPLQQGQQAQPQVLYMAEEGEDNQLTDADWEAFG